MWGLEETLLHTLEGVGPHTKSDRRYIETLLLAQVRPFSWAMPAKPFDGWPVSWTLTTSGSGCGPLPVRGLRRVLWRRAAIP